jgi:hypothetical protein
MEAGMRALLLAIGIFALTTHAVHADTDRPIRFNAGAGAAAGLNWIEEQYDVGLVGYVEGYLPLVPATAPDVLAVGRLQVNYFPAKGPRLGNQTLLSFGVDLRVNRAFSAAPNVYVFGGLGGARLSVADADTVGPNFGTGYDEMNPFVTFGGGLQSGRFLLEVRGYNVFGGVIDNLNWVQMTLGFAI